MRMFRLAALLILAAPACRVVEDRSTQGGAVDSARVDTEFQRGLRRGLLSLHEPPRFVPCGSTDTVALSATSAALADVRSVADSGIVFVVLAGQRLPVGQLTIDRVHYVSSEQFECFTDWSSFEYRATGQNPGWLAEIAGDRLVLRREGGATSTWTGVQKDSTGERILFLASGQRSPVRLTLQPRACQNPVTQARSVWTAQLEQGTEHLTGCAVPGFPARR